MSMSPDPPKPSQRAGALYLQDPCEDAKIREVNSPLEPTQQSEMSLGSKEACLGPT
jgi:hypothetical protein